MTDKEKQALREAFGIPEPDRKKDFTEQFRQRINEKHKKRISPVIMRMAATAAMLLIVVGVCANMPVSPKDINDNNNNLIETTSIGTSDISNSDENTTSTSAASDSIVSRTTASTVTAATVTAGTASSPQQNGNHAVTTKAAVSGHRTTVTTAAPKNDKTSSRTSHTVSKTNTTARNTTTTARRSSTSIGKVSTTTRRITTAAASTFTMTTAPANYTKPAVSTTYAAPVADGHDMTVEPEITYSIRGRVVNADNLEENSDSPVNSNEKGTDNAPVGVTLPFEQKIQEMFNNSYAVVLAKIDKIVYTSINGMPYTAENITIQKVYKGSVETYDKVTVYVSGGYMPANEYIKSHPDIYLSDTSYVTVYDSGGCVGEQECGETYLFFLRRYTPYLPYGTYSLTGTGDEGVFTEANGCFTCLAHNQLQFMEELFDKF
ncbi:MAG: hypothetical protein K6G33_10900 [Ruminococcus sp.]|uniref:hypothetical protein n=1 Tax=Ruminococcus sp. TaxID=41978 RepID=UPI0025F1F7B4|nr:hypothetical protein [Ruminococcus sp.]MCR5601233.1 hypothetical protein [Ruminococcus sp.]